MIVKDTLRIVILFSYLMSLISCKKYLDLKPSSSLQTIETLEDLQNLMDDSRTINNSYPGIGEILCDDYYVLNSDFLIADATQRNFYTWVKDDNTEPIWRNAYTVILTTNIVLDEQKDIEYSADDQEMWNNIKGSALFIRSYYFYGLAQLFASPYNKSGNMAAEPGIPLKLGPDIEDPITRASLEDTYKQIIKDLKEASLLLPNTPLNKVRPGKGAAYGALARTYLTIGEYDSALVYANRYLAIHDSLVDYNKLTSVPSPMAEKFDKEVIFYMRSNSIGFLSGTRAKADPVFYQSYQNNDLRKSIYYRLVNGAYSYKGDYDGTTVGINFAYTGIYTDEMYLIKAEALARKNNIVESMATLNKLSVTRYITGSFIPFSATSPSDALSKVLIERRKELVRRGIRWTDIRRLNVEVANSIQAERNLNNQRYNLPQKPYLLLLPKKVIEVSGVQQNN